MYYLSIVGWNGIPYSMCMQRQQIHCVLGRIAYMYLPVGFTK